MVTLKVVNNILSGDTKTLSVDEGVTIESLFKEHIDENSYSGTLVECYDLETGKSYFAPIEDNDDTINAVILVNGKDADLSYKVQENDIVSIIITPATGGGGSGWSWAGAFIGGIVGAFEGALAGTVYGGLGWGTLFGAIVGGIIGFFAGGIIGGQIEDAMTAADHKAKSGLDSEKLPDVRGATNQPLLNQPYPVVFGKHLVAPFIAGSPYNDISGLHGEDNYISVLYCVGYAPLRITDIRLGEQFLAHNQKWSGNQNLKNVWSGYLHGTDSSASSGSDTGDITNIWKNNDVSLEILQQTQGENVNYGTIYPYAKIQKDINANDLYIASGSITEIAKGENISYKGAGLKNGLRNNPIRLSEQFAKSLRVELNFPNGLYRSRTETDNKESTVEYYDIPMWIAIQWRVYSDENDKADGEYAGTMDLPTYNYQEHKYNLVDGKVKRGWIPFSAAKVKTINIPSPGRGQWVEPQFELPKVKRTVTGTSDSPRTTFQTQTIRTNMNINSATRVEFSTYDTVTSQRSGVIQSYEYPANTREVQIDSAITTDGTSKTLEVRFTPTELEPDKGYPHEINLAPKDFDHTEGSTEYISDAIASVGYNLGVVTFTSEERNRDLMTHTGNNIPSEDYSSFNNGWIGEKVFNLQSLGGEDGVNEFRFVTELDLIEWAENNLRADGDSDEEFAKKVKSYFFDSKNTTKSIEVRVVRISPNYIDETVSTKDYSAFKFNDIFVWKTLTSTMLEGDELMNNNRIVQKRPLPAEDMKKLCLIALKAKTDNVDQLSNTIKKLTCIAESFAPYYDDTQKKWLPENVKTKKGYYRYVTNEWVPITGQQYYEDRQNGSTYSAKGLKSKCLPAGNDFVEQIVGNVINVSSHIDSYGRIFIPDNDGTLNYCSNNAASVFLYGGIGPHLGNDAMGYSQNNFANNGIGDFNIDSFTKWYKFAEKVTDGSTDSSGNLVEMRFTANAYVYATEMLENLLSNIAIAGRAVYTRDNRNRIQVIVDKPERYPVALINQQNTLKSSYTISYADLPSGIQLTFPDEDDGYINNQLYCMTDGEDPACPHGAIEPYNFKFVTNNKQAWSLGRYLLANRVLNREVVTKQLGIEGASLGLGDLVKIQDDTMLIGTDNGGTIIKLIEDDNDIYGFLVNTSYHFTGELETGTQRSAQGVVVMQPGQYKEYRVITLRLAPLGTEVTVDGTLYKQLKGNTNLVLFETPIAKSQYSQSGSDFYVYKPEAGNVVGFGIIGKETSTYRIIKVKPAERNKYDFTLIKYQEDLYNYGDKLPSFQNNMTVPDRSGEDSYAISNTATQDDIQAAIASATDQAQGMIDSTFSTVPPVPSYLTVSVDRDKLHISCSVVGDGVNNVDYILYEVKRHDNTIKEIKGKYVEDSFFDRTVDGYPEFSELSQWQIRAKSVSLYTDENHEKITSDWSSYVNITTASLNQYGTWHIPNISAVKEVVDRTVIVSPIYIGSQQRVIYGTPITTVKIRRVGNLDCEESLTGVVEVLTIPQNPNIGTIIHYLGPDIEEGGVVTFKHGDYYRYVSQNTWEKAGRTFNEVLGIEEDPLDGEGNPIFYTPDFKSSVQYSAAEDNEPHYKKNSTEAEKIGSNKITHTLPLIGQTARIFKTGNVFTGKFTKDITDVTQLPSSPTEGDVVHYVGPTTYQGSVVEYIHNAYYLYENSSWVQAYSKTLMVPTTYEYSLQMTNESGYTTNEFVVQVTALNTNISDIVHSHEHYKELYVEKLSAISANVGMISQGGMGNFEDMLNCWALSDLSPEDSGVLGGVKKGTFRVGGENEYFRVTPIDDEGNYKIELKAGNIELTTDTNGDSSMDFTKGTFVYSDKRDSRLKLSPSGIVAEKLILTTVTPQSGDNPNQRGWYEYKDGKYVVSSDISVVQGKTYYIGNWQEQAKVIADDKGNMILTNSDNTPPFGYQAENATVYHIENAAHPEYEEVESPATPSNPQSLSFYGTVEDAGQYNPIIDTTSSPKCFNGNVVKDISNWTGRVVFFSKSHEVSVGNKGISIDGSSETVPAPLIGYNEAMKEDSTQDPNMRVGEYLGLNETQIQTGIFN